MKKRLTHLLLAAALAVAGSSSVRAGTEFWNFDDWLSGSITNLVIAGDDTSWALNDWEKYWDGNPPPGGDPSTNGYLQITPAAGGRQVAVAFPDIDDGAPIKAFKFTMDVRAGNGTVERPADGFSISYVRENDVALSNVVQFVNPLTGRGIPFGFAGGDGCDQANSPAGAGTLENGTKTGISIVFDAWQGNELPNTATNPNCTDDNDVEGIAVRVDDRTLIQVPLLQRNAPGGCADTNSMQTGPWSNDGGSYFNLSWCKLEVEKTADNKVNVTWKGRKILDGYQLQDYSPHKGRLLLAGRTGGNNQNVHIDNISLETTPAIEPLLKSLAVNANLRGWTLVLEDFPPSAVTTVTEVRWNNVDVTSSVNVSRSGLETSVVYTQANRLPSGSANAVRVRFETSLGQTIEVAANVATPGYFLMPPAYALPASAVSGQARGIALGQAWQTLAENRNSQGDNKINWTEEQLLGLWGANLATVPSPASTPVIDFRNGGDTGNFRVGGAGTGFWEGPDYSIQTTFGIGTNPLKSNTDDGALEWFAYVNFPTAGDYTMVVNSDDGFQLSTARNSRDRMGDVISFFNAGRGAGTGLGAGTIQRVIVDQAGVYAIRGIIFNRAGGFDVEWYTRDGDQLYLVNGDAAPQALQAWQNAIGTGAYVSSAIPVRSAVDVAGNQKIIIELANGSTTVNSGSIVLKVDGATVSPTITGSTRIELNPIGPNNLWPSGSSHSIELTFQDSASTSYSYAWSFTVAPYTLLTGGAPLGSEDPTKAGFMYKTYQVSPNGTTQLPNRIHVGEQVLKGLWGANTATLASGPVTDVINFDINQGAQGFFNANNGYPEALIPGIPGTGSNPTESFACEITTYVEFTNAGFFSLVFNSDDGFWTTAGLGAPSKVGQLTILSPPGLAGDKAAVMPAYNALQDYQTTNDVTAEVVVANPLFADAPLVNAAQAAGKIVLCYRGVNAFADKIQRCAAAGAVGVIVVQNRPDANPADGNFPIEMGATTGPIPAVMIFLADGNALTNAIGAGTVTARLNAMPNFAQALGRADVGRGASDTIYNVVVQTPGLYPLRTMWWQGGGGGNAEWASIRTGSRALLNDLNHPAHLRTFYGLSIVPSPEISISRDGNDIVLTYTGTLQSATAVGGPYTDVTGASSPHRIPVNSGPQLFLRTRN